MSWKNNAPELEDMRRILERLGHHITDGWRCAYAQAAIRSILDWESVVFAPGHVQVVGGNKRSVQLNAKRILLAKVDDQGQVSLLFGGETREFLEVLHKQDRSGASVNLSDTEIADLFAQADGRYDNLAENGDRIYVKAGPAMDGGDGGSGGAGGGEPPAGANGDGADGEGRGGLVEVISHPVMFSISTADYQTLLDNC